MMPDTDKHVPTPQFRTSLEADIRRTFATETRVPPSMMRRWRAALKPVALVLIGLVLGVGTQVASAQVQDARDRGQLERTLEVDQGIAAMRLQIARDEHERVRKAFDAGVLSRQSLLAAATEFRAAQTAVARLALDLAEIRATSSAPRNELWAPLVAGRDFVRDRLRLAVADAQARLGVVQEAFADIERGAAMGTVAPASFAASHETLARANREVRMQSARLHLRDQFLKDALPVEQIARREQQLQATFDLELAVRLMETAQARLQLAQQSFKAGVGTQLELKRAELEVLERQVEVQRLQAQVGRLR